MEEKVVRKTTAKKVTRKIPPRAATVGEGAVRPRAVSTASTRKAPTRVSESSTIRKKNGSLKTVAIGVLLFVLLIGMSALIGVSDKGQLDVAHVIAERKQKATPQEKQALEAVPTQQVETIPNGGLVGMGQEKQAPPAAAPVVGTSIETTASSSSPAMASSTAEAASSTEEKTPVTEV